MANNLEGMDNLIEKLFESYDLPSDKLEDIKSKLVGKVTDFLYEELSKLNSNSDCNIVLESVSDIDSEHLVSLLESSKTLSLNLNESNLISIYNKEGKFNFTLGESVDISKIDEEVLIESWDTESTDNIKVLLESIKSAVSEVI